jgi:hypothetical protein
MIGQECIHLHLEQRVVQRLLGRFVAQGFVHHDLSRACFAQSDDAVPRVILLGRLCLYGDGAARLHEQLVPVTATWRELDLRLQPLEPLGDVAEEKTLELLDRSLIATARVRLPTPVVERLLAAAATDIQQLLPHLERRCQASAEQAQRQLSGRGQAEAAAMREILQTQQKHIAETIKRIAKLDRRQLRLDYGDDEDELAQVEANQRYWAKRLEEIKGELKSEPERIEALYGVRARRIEPVGLVYLWPVTG